MSENLVFLAGRNAFRQIREKGLEPEMVRVVAGAAGGPKFMVLAGLDQVLFPSWFAGRSDPLFLIGASIGTWRFAAAAQNEPAQALEQFQQAYMAQTYAAKPTPHEVTCESVKVMNRYLDHDRIQEILQHPYMRLSILAARARWGGTDHKRGVSLGLGLSGAFLANVVHRRLLGLFFERGLFYDPRQRPPFWGIDGFPTQRIALSPANLSDALLASGSIPMVMSGVTDVPGAPAGVYWDGGLLDYHLDIPFTNGHREGIVLFPHYTDHIIPGWLDKKLPWRGPSPDHMKNVLLVAPSRQFVARLPYGKIPDRTDFYRFRGRDGDRKAYWQAVVSASQQLGREFLEVVETGQIRERVLPLGC